MAALLRAQGVLADGGGIHDEASVLRVSDVEVVAPGLVCQIADQEVVGNYDRCECGLACVALQIARSVCCVLGESRVEEEGARYLKYTTNHRDGGTAPVLFPAKQIHVKSDVM